MYYDGRMRQRGGGGLGDIFRVFGRTILPTLFRAGKSFVKKKAATLAPKAINAGVGLVQDVMSKKSFKQAIQQRGKRLISDAINMAGNSQKRQKSTNARSDKKSARPRGTALKRPRKKPPRPPDIFD